MNDNYIKAPVFDRYIQLCYTIGASCLAIIIGCASWEAYRIEHPTVGILLGAGAPLSLVSAWFVDANLFRRSRTLISYFFPGLGMLTGMVGISYFIFTVNTAIGAGFVAGGTALLAFFHYQIPSHKDDGRYQNAPEN